MKKLMFLAVAALSVVPGCRDSSGGGGGVPAPVPYLQVERVARPAINEGLFHSNDFLNALNSITPAQEPGALVGAVAAEAVATMDALDAADGVENLTATQVITAFIPDVMRIDSTLASGYGAALNAVGSPVRGRMLLDDVVDITYSYLITGLTGAVPDGVSYAGVAGNEAQPGHKPLLAGFPYLPKPN